MTINLQLVDPVATYAASKVIQTPRGAKLESRLKAHKLFLEEEHAQWVAGPSYNQRVGGSIPALVDVSLSKTLNSERLLVAVSTVCECNMIVGRFG